MPRYPRDYPRVCGGTGYQDAVRNAAKGLSPRVRGNRGFHPLKLNDDGTIPACAGEPIKLRNFLPPVRDYPRVCGGTFSF